MLVVAAESTQIPLAPVRTPLLLPFLPRDRTLHAGSLVEASPGAPTFSIILYPAPAGTVPILLVARKASPLPPALPLVPVVPSPSCAIDHTYHMQPAVSLLGAPAHGPAGAFTATTHPHRHAPVGEEALARRSANNNEHRMLVCVVDATYRYGLAASRRLARTFLLAQQLQRPAVGDPVATAHLNGELGRNFINISVSPGREGEGGGASPPIHEILAPGRLGNPSAQCTPP